MSNKLSSTNIAEILEAQIEAIKKVNDVIVSAKIDVNMLNNIAKITKPISTTLKALSDTASIMRDMKISNVIVSVKFRVALTGLVKNVRLIAEKLSDLKVEKTIDKKVGIIKNVVSTLLEISSELVKIGLLSIVLTVLSPLVLKSIQLVLDINKKLSKNRKVVNSELVENFGNSIVKIGKSLLLFVITTGAGVVPLVAVLSLLAVKLFLTVFYKLFDADSIKEIDVSVEAVKKITIAFALLSSAVLVMALTGFIIVCSWKQITITILFISLVISMFVLLDYLTKYIKEGNKTIFMIAGTLIILSMTVVLWALTGDLIAEKWKQILIVSSFVGISILLFGLLGLVSRIIKDGNKTILLIVLTLALLSLTVLLWIEVGKHIQDNIANIFCVTGFVFISIVLFFILGFAAATIQKGSLSILLLVVGLALISTVALLFIYVGKQIEENWQQLLLTSAFLLGVIAVVTALSFAFPFMVLGIASLILMSVGMLLFCASLLVLKIAIADFTQEDIDLTKALIGGLGDVIAGIGIQSLLIIPGIIALTTMGTALLIFSSSLLLLSVVLKKFKELNIDSEKDTDILKQPIDIMYQAVKFASSLKTTTILKGVAKIVALGSAVLSISAMCDTIQKFAELKMPVKFDKDGNVIEYRPMTQEEFDIAAQNIQKIISFILSAISDEQITTTLESLSKKAIKNIGLVMENTAGVSNLIDAIQQAVKFDQQTIEQGVFNVKELISQYIIALQQLFVGTGELVKTKNFWGKESYKLEITGAPEIDVKQIKTSLNAITEINKTLDPVKTLLQTIDELAKPEESNVQNIGKAIEQYVSSVFGNEKIVGIPSDPESVLKITLLRNLVDEQERISNIKTSDLQKNTESFIKFIDKANSVDTNKIKSIRDMFEQMAEFSKSIHGDFDKLADVLSEKLVDVLDRLQSTLQEMSEAPSTTTNSSSFLQNSVDEKTGKTTTSSSTTPTNNINDKKQEQRDKNLREIRDALDEITSVLRGVKDNTDNFYRGY